MRVRHHAIISFTDKVTSKDKPHLNTTLMATAQTHSYDKLRCCISKNVGSEGDDIMKRVSVLQAYQ